MKRVIGMMKRLTGTMKSVIGMGDRNKEKAGRKQ
jgi:hypothetical protein